MKRAGIAIDSWKLAIFQRHLTAAGYTVEKRPGLTTPDTLMLQVMTDDLEALAKVVRAANTEAAVFKSKGFNDG